MSRKASAPVHTKVIEGFPTCVHPPFSSPCGFSSPISVHSALSALGVIFGVGAFIAALAQTEGFEIFYINTVLGSEGSVVITDRFQEEHTHILDAGAKQTLMVASVQQRKFYPGIADAFRVVRVLKTFSDVVACSPIVEGRAFLRSGFSSGSDFPPGYRP